MTWEIPPAREDREMSLARPMIVAKGESLDRVGVIERLEEGLRGMVTLVTLAAWAMVSLCCTISGMDLTVRPALETWLHSVPKRCCPGEIWTGFLRLVARLDPGISGLGSTGLLRAGYFALLPLTATSVVCSAVGVAFSAPCLLLCYGALTIWHVWAPTGHTFRWIAAITFGVTQQLAVLTLNGSLWSSVPVHRDYNNKHTKRPAISAHAQSLAVPRSPPASTHTSPSTTNHNQKSNLLRPPTEPRTRSGRIIKPVNRLEL